MSVISAQLRRVGVLSIGTAGTRGLAAVSQILLAVWLSPEEFGYWAAANATIAFVAGLTNFGEVNGYLSGHGRNFVATQRATLRLNGALAAAGVAIASGYAIAGSPSQAVLALIAAMTIPVAGRADLLYSACVRHGYFRKSVRAQLLAAIAKLAVGVAIAVATRSAIAIAISVLVYSLIMSVALGRVVLHDAMSEPETDAPRSNGRNRFAWAVNSWMTTLPLQLGFIVGQFLAPVEVLGIYFLSYQITIGLTGLVSGPLAKTTLAALAPVTPSERSGVTWRLTVLLLGVLLAAFGVVSALTPAASHLVTGDWALAIPATAVFLAGVPVRLMTPILDAFQQAQNRWWQGTAFNFVDAIGTAASSTVLLTGDVVLFAAVLTAWKIILGLARLGFVLRAPSKAQFSALVVPTMLGSASLLAGAVVGGATSAVGGATALVCGAFITLVARRVSSDESGQGGDAQVTPDSGGRVEGRTPRVAITQPYVPAYREPLWQAVIDNLAARNVEARVFYGGTKPQKRLWAVRGDQRKPAWSTEVPAYRTWAPRDLPRVHWRRLPREWRSADVLVTEMEASNLNAWARALGRGRMVTLGHGASDSTRQHGLAQRLEDWLNGRAQRVLVYTPRAARALRTRLSRPEFEVVSFNNTTDTRALAKAYGAVSPDQVSAFRRDHGIPPEARVALFVGSLGPQKEIELMCAAADMVLTAETNWWLVVAGDGELRDQIIGLGRRTGRVSFLGRTEHLNLALPGRAAEVIVNPGRVGLLAVDALAMRTPILTANAGNDAPEVNYLTEGTHLHTTEPSVDAFANAWVNLQLADWENPEFMPSIDSAAATIAEAVADTIFGSEASR